MAVLQKSLPFAPWMDPKTWRLPGIQPVQGDDWLRVDEAFAGQMAERDARLALQRDAVHALLPEAEEAATELLAVLLQRLADVPGYGVTERGVRRPDGVQVAINAAAPLETAGRLVQEDLCILEQAGEEHRLTGAILCFPASWTLMSQRLGRALISIHEPVPPYDFITPFFKVLWISLWRSLLAEGSTILYRSGFPDRKALPNFE